jgi:hypothetical protein
MADILLNYVDERLLLDHFFPVFLDYLLNRSNPMNWHWKESFGQRTLCLLRLVDLLTSVVRWTPPSAGV